MSVQTSLKKIALVTPTLGGGGAERTAILLANGLAAQGHEVWLIAASLQGEQGKLLSEVNAAVHVVDLGGLRVARMLMPLSDWLKQQRPDALISTQTHANIISYGAVKLSGVRCQLICREVSTASVNLRHMTGVKKWLLTSAMRWVYHHCDQLVTVSQGVATDLQQYLHSTFKNLSVIYDPVITDEFYEKAKQPVSHEWFAQPRAKPVVLAVGRLTEAKNYGLLIHAFALLVKDTPANLLILGEGEDRAALQQLIEQHQLQDCVQLFGFDSNPYRYMAQCDVYAMSSKWEGLPGVLIQALAVGANAVSTDCPSGPAEIFASFNSGRLVPVNNAEALKTALSQALHDQAKPAVASAAAFTVENILQAYVAVINKRAGEA